jgi:hypothetical protein
VAELVLSVMNPTIPLGHRPDQCARGRNGVERVLVGSGLTDDQRLSWKSLWQGSAGRIR